MDSILMGLEYCIGNRTKQDGMGGIGDFVGRVWGGIWI